MGPVNRIFLVRDLHGRESKVEVPHDELKHFRSTAKEMPCKIDDDVVSKLSLASCSAWALEKEKAEVQAAVLDNCMKPAGLCQDEINSINTYMLFKAVSSKWKQAYMLFNVLFANPRGRHQQADCSQGLHLLWPPPKRNGTTLFLHIHLGLHDLIGSPPRQELHTHLGMTLFLFLIIFHLFDPLHIAKGENLEGSLVDVLVGIDFAIGHEYQILLGGAGGEI